MDDPDRVFEPREEARARDARRETEPRGTLERTLADLIRRGIEAGRGSFERVGDSIAPRDVAAGLASQFGDLRQAIVRAVAQEVGMFLREADIARELRKVVNGMSIEAKLKLGFEDDKPSDKPSDPGKTGEDAPEASEPKRPRSKR